MRKKSTSPPVSGSSKKNVSREVQPTTQPQKPKPKLASGSAGILGAIIALLALLLVCALVLAVLDKPQAKDAWALVHDLFTTVITTLITTTVVAARSLKRS